MLCRCGGGRTIFDRWFEDYWAKRAQFLHRFRAALSRYWRHNGFIFAITSRESLLCSMDSTLKSRPRKCQETRGNFHTQKLIPWSLPPSLSSLPFRQDQLQAVIAARDGSTALSDRMALHPSKCQDQQLGKSRKLQTRVRAEYEAKQKRTGRGFPAVNLPS